VKYENSKIALIQSVTDGFRLSVGVSKLGYTNSIFVDPGVKVNGAYYRDVLLSQQLLPAIRQVSGVLNL